MKIEELMELYRKEDYIHFSHEIHNSFPEIYERLRLAEKMVEIIENKFNEECPFVGLSEVECRKSGYSCNQCVRTNLRQKALAELRKEDNDGILQPQR